METSLRAHRCRIECVERLLETKIIQLKQWLEIHISRCGTFCGIVKPRIGAPHHDFSRDTATFRIVKFSGFRSEQASAARSVRVEEGKNDAAKGALRRETAARTQAPKSVAKQDRRLLTAPNSRTLGFVSAISWK
ncbi:hypothetical protein [Burkholderia sp. 3C]